MSFAIEDFAKVQQIVMLARECMKDLCELKEGICCAESILNGCWREFYRVGRDKKVKMKRVPKTKYSQSSGYIFFTEQGQQESNSH